MDLPNASAQPDGVKPHVAVKGESFRVENDLIDSSKIQLGSCLENTTVLRQKFEYCNYHTTPPPH